MARDQAQGCAEHGAVGCLIYSDPQQDGYFHGDPYPEGAMRPAEGAQRGSVMDMPVYPVILKHLVSAQCPEQKRSRSAKYKPSPGFR